MYSAKLQGSSFGHVRFSKLLNLLLKFDVIRNVYYLKF